MKTLAETLEIVTVEFGIFAMQFKAGTSERGIVKRAYDLIEAQAARIKELEAEKARA